MAKYVRLFARNPIRLLLALGVLCGIALLLFVRRAEAAPYANPFWANNSTSQESAVPMVANLAMTPEGVDARTGELMWDHFLFRTSGKVEDNGFAIRWRSMISGASQLGRQILPSWETTANYVVLNQGNPTGPSGHQVDIRRPSGRIDAFVWNGTAYAAPTDVFDTLTTNGGGNYVLTDKYGAALTFNAGGMPNLDDDRNGNRDTYTYDLSHRLTAITDDRGKAYTTASNANNYLTSITDPAGRAWTFTYDASDNLKTIKTPTTADQTSGITTTLNYDGSNRLTSVTDGRGNSVWSFAYVGVTGQIASVTIDGNTVSYSYAAGITTRTDRNGNVYRYYHAGNQVTKTDLLVAAAAKYVALYRYSGVQVSNTVLPRGNRIDFTWDTNGNLTTRRHRTADTATNHASDLVDLWAYNGSNFLTSYTDPESNVWTFGRDTAGNLTSVTNPTVTNPVNQTSSTSYTYNGSGQLLTDTDEEGNKTTYTYFASGTDIYLLDKIEVDATGLDLETTYTYDSAGNVATRTDPRSNAWTYTWDNLRRMTQKQAPTPLSYKTKYNYDGNGNTTQRDVENIDNDGNQVAGNAWLTTTYTYTNTDDVATIVEEIDVADTRTTSLDYDSNQNRIRVTKPEGNKEKWEYNERDWVTKHIRGEGATEESDSEYEYDENGNRTVDEDGRNNDTTHAYDLFDRRTKTTNALSHYTEWEFDKNSSVTKVIKKDSTNAELQRETLFYDERNRRWKISALFKDPSQTHSDAVTTIERLKTGQVKKVTNPRSKITTYDYDAALRRTKVTDAFDNEWEWTLDDNGNPTAWSVLEKDGSTDITHDYEATYDAMNRRLTSVEVDRNNSSNKLTTTYSYDSRSNLVFRVNAEDNPTRWTFDGLDRMTKRERALTVGTSNDDILTAQVTQWGHDENNRLTSHKDDGPNESTWAYDALDRATTMTYPDTKTVAYVYDDTDNVTKTTDPAGNVVDDVFDALNRNTSRTVTRATGFLGTTSETRTYDALNRIATNEDNDYKLEYDYAVIGLQSYVAEETQSYVGGTAYAKTVTKTYDANGNRLTEAYPAGANMTLDYVYNDIDVLTSISDGTNTIASYTHIGLRKKTTTFQSGATRTNSYTGFRNEIETVHHETSTPATILRLDYAYNKVHDRLYERYGASGSTGDAFSYDKMRRLTNAWMGSTNPASPAGNSYVTKIDYNYDDDGNRTSVVSTPYGQTAATTNYTTNNLNEYTAVGGTTHVWDANGNLTDNGTLKFEYDYKNLIVKVRNKSDSSLVATYKYDAEGRRVEKDVGGTVERFLRSRVREAEGSYRRRNNPGDGARYDMSHVLAVYDGSNTWLQNFVWNDEVDGIQTLEQKDVLDYDTDGNTTELTRSYYHRNALGSVMEITDANQTVAVSYRYDPYGNVAITRGGSAQSSDPLGQQWMFTGRYLDEESDLYYYRARNYDPERGRFAQRDPLGYAAEPNLFEYVGSSPTTVRDPSGEQEEETGRERALRVLDKLEQTYEDELDWNYALQARLQTALDNLPRPPGGVPQGLVAIAGLGGQAALDALQARAGELLDGIMKIRRMRNRLLGRGPNREMGPVPAVPGSPGRVGEGDSRRPRQVDDDQDRNAIHAIDNESGATELRKANTGLRARVPTGVPRALDRAQEQLSLPAYPTRHTQRWRTQRWYSIKS